MNWTRSRSAPVSLPHRSNTRCGTALWDTRHACLARPGKTTARTRKRSRWCQGDLPNQLHGFAKDRPRRYHGYYFRVLTAQGPAAAGGAHNYLLHDLLRGGFALVAWPTQHAVTGVHTFIVNQDGVVYERNLGPQKNPLMAPVTAVNPDANWKPRASWAGASSLTSMDSVDVRLLSGLPMLADRRFNGFSRRPHPRSSVLMSFQHGQNRPFTTR